MTDRPKIYRVGTLTYTKAALTMLLFWLIWGDVCYTMMEEVVGPILRLKFKEFGASNAEIGLILGTIPGIIYAVLNPIISFRSDRFRSPRGRRLPFILNSLPFLVLALVSMAYGDRLGFWLHGHVAIFAKALTAKQMAIYTLGAFGVAFTFFNTFLVSTFWYLFNDVIPQHLLGRFMSWFRAVSILSAALYNFCFFRFAGTHSAALFLGAAALYFVGFGLMLLNVKEGEYPPPPPYAGGKTGVLVATKTFLKEPHAFRHYWYLWLSSFVVTFAQATNGFRLFLFLAMGLSLAQIGIIYAIGGIPTAVITLGAGWLADRFHPLRIALLGSTLKSLIASPVYLLWLFWHPSPSVSFGLLIAIALCLDAPCNALESMGDPAMLMRVFPRERYGQFCSTRAFWGTMGGLCGSVLVGVYLDFMTHRVGSEHAYFYLPVWRCAFYLPGSLLLLMFYRSWKRLGGDESYIPPTPETASAAVAVAIPEIISLS